MHRVLLPVSDHTCGWLTWLCFPACFGSCLAAGRAARCCAAPAVDGPSLGAVDSSELIAHGCSGSTSTSEPFPARPLGLGVFQGQEEG